jgi:hypothetical protein
MVETWQALLAAAVIMVVYALVGSSFGPAPTLTELVLVVVFGLVGWYLGQRLTDRL